MLHITTVNFLLICAAFTIGLAIMAVILYRETKQYEKKIKQFWDNGDMYIDDHGLFLTDSKCKSKDKTRA